MKQRDVALTSGIATYSDLGLTTTLLFNGEKSQN
jgi:hypothetical protein